jgi:hypothetical protein
MSRGGLRRRRGRVILRLPLCVVIVIGVIRHRIPFRPARLRAGFELRPDHLDADRCHTQIPRLDSGILSSNQTSILTSRARRNSLQYWVAAVTLD